MIVPCPSRLGGRVSRRTTCGCCSCSSAASSQVMTRSVGSMKAVRVFSRVVLPEPVPPEMTMLQRQAPMTPRTRAPSGLMEANSTRFFIVSLSFLNFRIVRVAPSMRQRRRDDVDAAAVRQAGVADRASFRRRGGRPGDTIRWQMFISWVLSRNRTLVSWTLPPTSMNTRSAPLTMMSAMSSRASSGSSGP